MEVEKRCSDVVTQKVLSTSNEHLPRNLNRSIKEIIEKEGYQTYKIQSRKISTEGGNYLGVLYEVDIKGVTISGEKETNIFIKHVLPEENVKIISVSEVYSKEVFFYTKLSKVFKDLQDEAGVPDDERYKAVKAFEESNIEDIILENVARKGYSTIFRREVMPLKFAELSVQQLARFHSLSFVLQQKRPHFFEKEIKVLKQSVQCDETHCTFIKKIFDFSVKDLDYDRKMRMQNILPTFLDKYPKYLAGATAGIKCLCHGDYRMNNILFKQMDGEISDVIPVDFQLLFYGSPVVDLIYFVFGASDSQFRRNHLEYLKDLYFETMEKFLRYFDIDVNSVYPRDNFDAEYHESLDYGLMIGLFIMPFFFTLEDDVPDFSKDDFFNVTVNLDYRFKERLEGIIDDMIELGVV